MKLGPVQSPHCGIALHLGQQLYLNTLFLFSRQKIIKIKRKWNMHTTSVYILI